MNLFGPFSLFCYFAKPGGKFLPHSNFTNNLAARRISKTEIILRINSDNGQKGGVLVFEEHSHVFVL